MKTTILKTACVMLFALMATILFTACGGKSSDKQVADAEKKIDAEAIVEEVFKGEARSKAAAEHYIKKSGGLNPSHLLPDWNHTTEPEQNNFYGDSGKGVMRFWKPEGEELSKEDYIAWVRKVYEATKKISDDGFNIRGFEDSSEKDEALSEKPFDEMIEKGDSGWFYLGMYNWGYRLNGKFMRIYTERSDKNDKYYAQVDVCNAMHKSMDELFQDAEKALEREDVQKALKDLAK